MPLWKKFGDFIEANRSLGDETVWPRFWLIQMWLLSICAMRELVRTIGREKVIHMFIGHR